MHDCEIDMAQLNDFTIYILHNAILLILRCPIVCSCNALYLCRRDTAREVGLSYCYLVCTAIERFVGVADSVS